MYISADSYRQPSFWLVNILLRKLDTLSKKEMKTIKTQILWQKSTNKCQKRNINSFHIWHGSVGRVHKKNYITFFLWTRPTDPWCNMLELYRGGSFCQTHSIILLLTKKKYLLYFNNLRFNRFAVCSSFWICTLKEIFLEK